MPPPKVSVLIPTYNAAETIRATLESVLSQTLPPDETLVMDDGSTDDTALIVKTYEPRVTLFRQENKGAASARNNLCARAKGDIIALLDSDDLWHPSYLETQCRNIADYPNAAAYFTGHLTLYGSTPCEWPDPDPAAKDNHRIYDLLDFFECYDRTPGDFYPSFCCVTKRVLSQIGEEPFRGRVAIDAYFIYLLIYTTAPQGFIVHSPRALAAYRVRRNSLSANLLNTYEGVVEKFGLLQDCYSKLADKRLSKAFRIAFASSRRLYARHLMGAEKTPHARRELWDSLRNSRHPVSIAKSLAWLSLTYMPSAIQPKWPPPVRCEWRGKR